jgi:malate permease and related proteins
MRYCSSGVIRRTLAVYHGSGLLKYSGSVAPSLLILIALSAGFALGARSRAAAGAGPGLSAFALYVALPALTLLRIHGMPFQAAALAPAALPWCGFLCAVLLYEGLRRAGRITSAETGALVLSTGLANTSFVGFALVEALVGPQGMAPALVADQAGSFLALSTGGAWAVAHYGRGGRGRVPRLWAFPPFLAFLLALALRGWEYPAPLASALERLGDTLVPVALFTVGLGWGKRWHERRPERARRARGLLALGLGYRLVAAPLLGLGVALLLGLRGLEAQVSVLEAAMAPMITGALLAQEAELEPELAEDLLGVGIPLSFLTVTIWYQILLRIFSVF